MARRRKRQQLSFELLLLPCRCGILFPNTANPILAGRRTSVAAIEEAALHDSVVVVATQRESSISEIELGDLYPIGTEAVVSCSVPDHRRQPCAASSENIQGRQAYVTLRGRSGAFAARWPVRWLRATPVL